VFWLGWGKSEKIKLKSQQRTQDHLVNSHYAAIEIISCMILIILFCGIMVFRKQHVKNIFMKTIFFLLAKLRMAAAMATLLLGAGTLDAQSTVTITPESTKHIARPLRCVMNY
jgi:hypothetical protein